MTAQQQIRSQIRDFLEQGYARSLAFGRDFWGFDLKPDQLKHALEVKLLITGLAVASLADVFLGPWALRGGMARFIAFFLTTLILTISFLKWVGADPARASSIDLTVVPKSQSWWGVLTSGLVLVPLSLATMLAATFWRDDVLVQELRPVYSALHSNRHEQASELLDSMIKDPYASPETYALAALLAMRVGTSEDARSLAEKAVWEARTTFSRACGSHTRPIDRSSCDTFLDQVTIHDTSLSREFHERYCARFGADFPGAEMDESGCGAPAPFEW